MIFIHLHFSTKLRRPIAIALLSFLHDDNNPSGFIDSTLNFVLVHNSGRSAHHVSFFGRCDHLIMQRKLELFFAFVFLLQRHVHSKKSNGEGVACACSLGVSELLWEALPARTVHLQIVLCWTRAMSRAVLCLKVRGIAQYTTCITNE